MGHNTIVIINLCFFEQSKVSGLNEQNFTSSEKIPRGRLRWIKAWERIKFSSSQCLKMDLNGKTISKEGTSYKVYLKYLAKVVNNFVRSGLASGNSIRGRASYLSSKVYHAVT